MQTRVWGLALAPLVIACASENAPGIGPGSDSGGFDVSAEATVDAALDTTVARDSASDGARDGAPGDATIDPEAAADTGSDAPIEAALPDSAPPADVANANPDGAPTGWISHPCNLPGSVQFMSGGKVVVPGATTGAMGCAMGSSDLSFLSAPFGFCAHYFGNVGNARQIRFAPGGELFVASPTASTTSGGQCGQNAIVVLADDNGDGLADTPITFLSGLPSTQGLLFANGYFYYQDGSQIMRVRYARGDRLPSGAAAKVADIALSAVHDSLHWPKSIDIADDGTIYVANGGSQGDICFANGSSPDGGPLVRGAILKLDGTPGGTPIVQGLRNPIALRCARGHNHCFGLELAKDYSGPMPGREKLFPIRPGDDWGFPCCASTNLPYTDVVPVPGCSGVATDTNSFLIGDTPFGVDFEPGLWPDPWKGRAYVAIHGVVASWTGARLVAIAMDPATGLPLPSSTAPSGSNTGAMLDFAFGWDNGKHANGRPTAIAFSPDGRLFLANDTTGDIVWIAPLGL
jgi:glucose/arabinose dehydrogenase